MPRKARIYAEPLTDDRLVVRQHNRYLAGYGPAGPVWTNDLDKADRFTFKAWAEALAIYYHAETVVVWEERINAPVRTWRRNRR